MNKYNIKVGDYVETWDGDIGVIEEVVINTFSYRITSPNSDNYDKGVIYWCPNDSIDSYKPFKRIGAYDFSKKENKFKPISEFNQNGIITYADKINELIDHINAIQERLNEYDSTRTN